MKNNPDIRLVESDADLQGILDLQVKNLSAALDIQSRNKEGFVTVHHDLDLLREMHEVEPSIMAISDSRVVGYCLAMHECFRDRIPIIVPMFHEFDSLEYRGCAMNEVSYIVTGQVCVAKEFRGQGVFDDMYKFYRECYSLKYPFLLTEISRENERSLKAHLRVGFEVVKTYTDESRNVWDIVLWNWRQLRSGVES